MRVAVLGGGISGLVAAYRLRRAGVSVQLFDDSPADGELGGKLRTTTVDGVGVDVGAEAFLVRRPEALGLITELGLRADVVHPQPVSPSVYADGRLHDLPRGTLMGIPADRSAVAGLVTEFADGGLTWPVGGDRSVAEVVEESYGRQTVARSVDPLLGGVYSGTASTIGVRAALPALARELDAGARTLGDAVRAAISTPASGPVFGALRGGYRTLIEPLTAGLAVTRGRVGGVQRAGSGLAGGHLVDGERFDEVIAALPAPALAEVFAEWTEFAALAATVPVASTAVVLLRLDDSDELPTHSGVLVATGEALDAKAFTLSSRKWAHIAAMGTWVRASFGRVGDTPGVDALTDSTLVDFAVRDLGVVLGRAVHPIAAHVQRWPQGLPQYGPHHGELVAQLRALTPVPLAGALYEGVGVPACIASGEHAATDVLARLAKVAR